MVERTVISTCVCFVLLPPDRSHSPAGGFASAQIWYSLRAKCFSHLTQFRCVVGLREFGSTNNVGAEVGGRAEGHKDRRKAFSEEQIGRVLCAGKVCVKDFLGGAKQNFVQRISHR